MQSKLILIEGIPGSGKTTIAKRIHDFLTKRNIDVKLFNEGDIHPADLAWCAHIPIDKYNELLKKQPDHVELIRANTSIEDGFAVVAYTKLGFAPSENDVMSFMQSHEVYDGKIPASQFKEIHLNRWNAFAQRAIHEEKMHIFECAFFQNHICELMGIHNEDNRIVEEHLLSLMNKVKKLDPILIYLSQPNITETISRVAEERVSPDKNKYKAWIDLVIEWVEKTKYAKEHGLTGFNGAIKFFEKRKELELAVYQRIDVEKHIIENTDYNWEKVFNEIEDILTAKII